MSSLEFKDIGSARIYLGDSKGIVSSIEYDRVITDPPYEIDTAGGGLYAQKGRTYLRKLHEANLDNGFDDSILIESAKNAKSLMVFMHNDQIPHVLDILSPYYERFCVLFWKKPNPTPVHNKHYLPDTEPYIHFWNKEFAPEGGYRQKGRSIEHKIDTEVPGHPTTKPISVMSKLVINGSSLGDVIFDPFMGSGSTGVAAVRHGRKFIGCEINEEFFELAARRIHDEQNQLNLF